MVDLWDRRSEEERRRLEVAGSARGYRRRRGFQKPVQQLLAPRSQRAVSYCLVRRILYPQDVGKCVVTKLALRNSNRLRTAFPIHQHEIFGFGREPKGVGCVILSLIPTTCARHLPYLSPTMPICWAPEVLLRLQARQLPNNLVLLPSLQDGFKLAPHRCVALGNMT